MQNYTLKVIAIRRETQDTITLCFKQPGLKKIKYQAGQYLTLIFRINGRRYIRPYSFSSAPSVDIDLEVTVKRVPNGIVSNHINDVVKEGDVIEAMQPMGDFVLPDTEIKNVFLWGAGSGITPLISIAKYTLSVHKEASVKLIYGNKLKESTIFYDEINKLCRLHQHKFKSWHFHTRLSIEENLPDVIQGRINPSTVIDILNHEDLKESLHFICGPVGLKESVKNKLTISGIPDSNIFSEDFELVKNPKDFEEIETQNVTLFFQEKSTVLEVIKGKSILETALDANIELPYSCQTGNCSTCKGKLKTGKLKMIGLREQRTDLGIDEFLLCCSHPLDGEVYIEC
ncbi:FAD-binding oxidoreductase [Pedobacter alpinus]|uniref:FAD-binding oxidoreductase n=1 Tax=Pedobacter alpinus TaxID=1590643 RepID=A0ABW5TRZ5_9SPHI